LADEVTKADKKSRRLRERMQLALPARVNGRERGNRAWTEITRLIDVTPFGARLRLARPIDVGQLVQLMTGMPRQLRTFDHAEDQYRVWTIVRSVRLLEQQGPKDSLVEIGVAFIGKRPPPAYDEDPLRRFHIAQKKLETQLWSAHEAVAGELEEIEIDERRRESRQLIPVDLFIEVFDGYQIVASENSVTENISRGGATVFTALELEVGTFVKLSNKRQNARVLGVVRARRTGGDGITRLHLEFVGSEWPL
jgi:hypothetical protein